jgi:ferrochelatase
MAYGSPNSEEEVEPFYTDIRGGRKPSVEEVENLRTRYRSIGGRSPLLRITESTARKLEARLGGNAKVYVGMKHWHPFISETFDLIAKDGIEELLAIALAPHYSKMSIGGYQESVRKANELHGSKVDVKFVDQWFKNQLFLDKWRERIVRARSQKFSEGKEKVFYLFSAHSLPERILAWNDPYKDQLLETADILGEKLLLSGISREQYGFAFQSAGHTKDPWLGPDILDKLKELGHNGWRNVLVAPIGFVSDHLEILYDIDIEAQELARQLGIHLERTESFNDSEDFIDVLESVVAAARSTQSRD